MNNGEMQDFALGGLVVALLVGAAMDRYAVMGAAVVGLVALWMFRHGKARW